MPIANNAVNAVTMTTMPDAPVDPVTGLQVPTIAVGTAAGLSVIQNDGSVVNSSAASNFIQVTIDKYAVTAVDNANANFCYALNPGGLGASFATVTNTPNSLGGFVKSTSKQQVTAGRGRFGRAANAALVSLLRLNEATPAASLSATIADAYNTGWMAGDIRRCYLSDVSVGALGGNLLAAADSNFSADTGYWTKDTGVTISGGVLNFSNVAANGALYRTSGYTAGKAYTVTFTISAYTAGGARATVGGVGGTTRSAPGTYTETIVAGSSIGGTGIYSTTAGTTLTCSSIVIVEGVVDRSYKAAKLQTFGTLTRAQVGVGSQLVAYSGFSAANYLQEAAYSADLDFGTGSQFWKPAVSIPAGTLPLNTPAPGGVGSGTPTVAYLPLSNFPATSVPMTMNTAEWTKGTGWSASGAGTVSCDGTQTGQTDLSWASGANRAIPGTNAIVRRWTITVTALSGTLTMYPYAGAPFSITATGTYTGIGGNWTGGSSEIFRMGAGGTCSLTVTVDDLGSAVIAERSAATGPLFRLGVNAVGYLVGDMSDGTTPRQVVSAATYLGTGFIHPSLSYDTSGSLTLRVNGQQVQQTTGTPLLTMNNASGLLTVGNNFALTAPFPGSIALLRIGATVPTADQSVWMYEQEKEMFRDGAQVCLPDSGAAVDLDYDPVQDKWKVVSAANESSFVGVVQTSQAPVSAGSFTHAVHRGGIKLLSRSTTNPGVDITIPALNAIEQMNKRAEDARALARLEERFDYVGGFTATTVIGSALLTSVAGLSIPATATVRGAQVSGTGIPANTTILDIQGTTIQLSAACTAAGSGVSVSFTDFILPTGYEAKSANAARAIQYEGATADWTRRFDGFREGERFGAAPGPTAKVQLIARRITQ